MFPEPVMTEMFCRIKSYIQPFERVLALKEAEALSGTIPLPLSDGEENPLEYRIHTSLPSAYLSDRLTYWEDIREGSSGVRLTRQVRREATVNVVRNGFHPELLRKYLPFNAGVPIPNRRVLRYGSHGIHEYRGKFFPQLVRSLLNIAGVNQQSIVIDPLCGSGTTLAEAVLLGCRTVGLDINPLSVLMSQVKCDILSVRPDRLLAEYESLKADILAQAQHQISEMAWFPRLHPKSQIYLSNWFSPQALASLDPIAASVHSGQDTICRDLFRVSLSNIIRRISWQKDDDLRIRKDIRPELADIDIAGEFIAELTRTVKLIVAFLYENCGVRIGNAHIVEGDARESDIVLRDIAGRTDAIVTSPPYATALPYLDTDRLSLFYLDLLPKTEHRIRNLDMIGNREITKGQREKYLEEFEERIDELPAEVARVIALIDKLNRGTDAGFRRKNLPALLARYFLDMKKVFETFKTLLRAKAPAYVVVGNNYTIAGGQRVEIETDKWLAELGESAGLELEETIPMEMLVSRDIFRKNTGTAETILCFRKHQ